MYVTGGLVRGTKVLRGNDLFWNKIGCFWLLIAEIEGLALGERSWSLLDMEGCSQTLSGCRPTVWAPGHCCWGAFVVSFWYNRLLVVSSWHCRLFVIRVGGLAIVSGLLVVGRLFVVVPVENHKMWCWIKQYLLWIANVKKVLKAHLLFLNSEGQWLLWKQLFPYTITPITRVKRRETMLRKYFGKWDCQNYV